MSPSTHPQVTDLPILATKLFAPRLRDRTVRRRPLMSRLDDAAGFVLVSAPAGFGKSTTLADWLERSQYASTWLSLEPGDNDLRRFLEYLAAALGRLDPSLGRTLTPYLQAPQLPTAEVILNPLLNELSSPERTRTGDDGPPSPQVLILDDYHCIENPAIHGLIQLWIEHLPPAFRLILSTRVDPPFSVSRWRGQGRLTELRADDLRFSDDETRRFLSQAMALDLSPRLTESLHQRTEGWAVGLQMAALSLRGQQEPSHWLDDFTGSHRFVLDYLTDEVLSRQDADVLDFLLRVSNLERFSAPLCDALLGRQDSATVLNRLEAQNLFLISLDDERKWFRFHHLFRQLLAGQADQRLSASELRALRLAACDWLIEAGLPDEALNHALAAEDRRRTLAVLARFAETTLQQGDAVAVTRWFDQVPLPWIETEATLPLTRALALFLAVRWSDLEASAPRLMEWMGRDLDPAAEGRSLALAACAATVRADPTTAIDAARRALQLLPAEDRLLRAVCAITLGVSLLQCSAYDEALQAFSDAAGWSEPDDPLGLDATCAYYEGRIALIRGNTQAALDHHRRSWQGASEGSLPQPMASLALVGQAEVYFEWGELDRASDLAQKAVALNRGCFPFNELRARQVLVDVARARRRYTGALAAADALNELMRHAALKHWQPSTRVHRVQTLALKAQWQGDRQAAAEWQTWGDDFSLTSSTDLESKLLPEDPPAAAIALGIRWLLWQGHTQLALDTIRRLRALAERRQWRRALIECWLLEARAFSAEHSSECTRALRQAVDLAEGGRFIQALADEREWLRALPETILRQALDNAAPAFQTRLMTALDVGARDHSKPRSPAPANPAPGEASPEVLSQRELEVLQMVAAGGTNAAVGEALFISPRTVKKHLENIYGKLDVHNRVEAIHRARKLGLLTSHDDGPVPSSPSSAVASS